MINHLGILTILASWHLDQHHQGSHAGPAVHGEEPEAGLQLRPGQEEEGKRWTSATTAGNLDNDNDNNLDNKQTTTKGQPLPLRLQCW